MDQEQEKAIKQELIYQLRSGFAPTRGFQYFATGINDAAKCDLAGLDHAQKGNGAVRVVIAHFGTGKTLHINLSRSFATGKKFVTSVIRFDEQIKLSYGIAKNEEQSPLWQAIVNDLRPTLPVILENFYENLKPEDGDILKAAEEKLEALTMTGSKDFKLVIKKYVQARIQGGAAGEETMRHCIDWLKGAYRRRDVARKDLGNDLENIIKCGNWYQIIQCFSKFVTLAGYNGLAVYMDEASALYDIELSSSRQANYAVILSLLNDNIPYLYVMLAGRAELITNRRRGMFSNEALEMRLKPNPHEEELAVRDYNQPLIVLKPLTPAEDFILLRRIKQLYEEAFDVQLPVTEENLKALLEEFLNQPGGERMLVPRELIRGFLFILVSMHNNPDTPFSHYCKEAVAEGKKKLTEVNPVAGNEIKPIIEL